MCVCASNLIKTPSGWICTDAAAEHVCRRRGGEQRAAMRWSSPQVCILPMGVSRLASPVRYRRPSHASRRSPSSVQDGSVRTERKLFGRCRNPPRDQWRFDLMRVELGTNALILEAIGARLLKRQVCTAARWHRLILARGSRPLRCPALAMPSPQTSNDFPLMCAGVSQVWPHGPS